MEIKKYGLELGDYYRPHLVEEDTLYYKDGHLTTPDKITAMLNKTLHMDRLAEERVVMIAFTADMKPIGIFELGRGTISSCMFSTREMTIRVLLSGAANVAVVHNHPSGSVVPSRSDEMTFSTISNAMNIMGIELIDFIIIGRGYLSYRESGLMKRVLLSIRNC